MERGRQIPRPFSLHWGSGQIVEEATCSSEYHQPSIQLLEFDDNTLAVRFCYYDLEGRFQRSPLMLGKDDIRNLKSELARNPRLMKLLKSLIN